MRARLCHAQCVRLLFLRVSRRVQDIENATACILVLPIILVVWLVALTVWLFPCAETASRAVLACSILRETVGE